MTAPMSTPANKPKFTLKDLESVKVEDTAPSLAELFGGAPSADSKGPSPSRKLDATEYLPDGVSAEVGRLLGMPSREEAERRVVAEEEAERAATERAAQAERDQKAAAAAAARAAEVEAMQRAIAAQAERDRLERKRFRMMMGLGATALLALTITVVAMVASRPRLDLTPYDWGSVSVLENPARREVVAFLPIPEPPPVVEPVVEPTPRSSGSSSSSGSSGRRERQSNPRRNDLF
jgi:hypothetical protein